MQIVIDMPKEMWERIKDGYVPLGISKYLKNGIQLQEGHGRLIDADELFDSLIFPSIQVAETFKKLLDDAPTIIEADEEE